MSVPFAYLAQGRLYIVSADGRRREIESRFAEDYRSRARSVLRKTSWKTQGTGARFMSGGGLGGAALWGEDFDLDQVPVTFTGLSRGRRPGELLYTLSTGIVGGVFALDLESLEEQRVFHSAEHRIEQLATSPDHHVVACVLRNKDGTASIGVMAPDGSEVHHVTDGDAIDMLPRWLPQGALKDPERNHQLVFQSAGIGRDEGGLFVAIGPAKVELLDAEHGEMQTLLEDQRFDHLAPVMAPDRTVYSIRRPYSAGGAISPWRALLDVLLFPFRLLGAVLSYLNFFTVRYTGKPLLTSGDARRRSADLRQMMMLGNLAGARQAADRAAEKPDDDALVRDWTLVATAEDRQTRAVTGKVRAFDLLPDGRLIVTNGSRVAMVAKDGALEELHRAEGITAIVALDLD